jgi:hypothetical protein
MGAQAHGHARGRRGSLSGLQKTRAGVRSIDVRLLKEGVLGMDARMMSGDVSELIQLDGNCSTTRRQIASRSART